MTRGRVVGQLRRFISSSCRFDSCPRHLVNAGKRLHVKFGFYSNRVMLTKYSLRFCHYYFNVQSGSSLLNRGKGTRELTRLE